jgi:ADP-ribose pyrophosphatase YjhB (NUDIX family)
LTLSHYPQVGIKVGLIEQHYAGLRCICLPGMLILTDGTLVQAAVREIREEIDQVSVLWVKVIGWGSFSIGSPKYS